MLPNFIIAGAQKCGTSSLDYYLSQHPNIYTYGGEIDFFGKNFEKGLRWYENHFDKWNNEYKNEKAIGEKTPSYIYQEQIPKRILETLPNVKIIFILRNPVKRAYSHYLHNVYRGRENKTFEEALILEEKRIKKNKQYDLFYSYKNRGIYYNQIMRYIKLFPSKNLLFLQTEDLKNKPKDIMKKCFSFLEIETDISLVKTEKQNIYRQPKNYKLASIGQNNLVKKFNLVAGPIRFNPMIFFIRKINTAKGKKPPMNEKTKEELENFFKPWNKKLSKSIKIDLNIWN